MEQTRSASTILIDAVAALAEAMDLLGADAPVSLQDEVVTVLALADERAVLDPTTVLVALVGATGSGKSSLLNALVGADVAPSSVLRPTTRAALAVAREDTRGAGLLDRIGVVSRVDAPVPERVPEGVVLLDLPDIDSTDAANRALARHVKERADLLIWVVDPQKYADDVIHSQWIAPMARSAGAMLVVLNQADRLSEHERDQVCSDLRRLLIADGIGEVPIVLTSAVTNDGVEDLRETITVRADHVRRTAAHLIGELSRVSDRVLSYLDVSSHMGTLDARTLIADVVGEAERAVDVSSLAAEAAHAYRHRAHTSVGWLPLRWLSYLRADPLRRRHITSQSRDKELGSRALMSIDVMTPAARARMGTVVRRLCRQIGQGRPHAWQDNFAQIGQGSLDALADKTDLAVATALGAPEVNDVRKPRWWFLLNSIQLIGWVIALVGVGWFLARWLSVQYLLIDLPVPIWRGFPLPLWMIVGAIALTLVCTLIGLLFARIGGRRRARRLRHHIRAQLSDTMEDILVRPLIDEDERQRKVMASLSSTG